MQQSPAVSSGMTWRVPMRGVDALRGPRVLPWWLLAGGVGLAAAGLYAGTVSPAWSWMDDWLLLHVGRCFSNVASGQGVLGECLRDPVAGRIRPGMFVYDAATFLLFGTNAVAHQLFRLVLLVLITLGVGGTAWRWTQNRVSVVIATVLFAFLPLGAGHWDRLGSTDVPAMVLFVWAVFLASGQPTPRGVWGSVALATAAALTKEPLALMNLGLAAFLWMRGAEGGRMRLAALALLGVSVVTLGSGLAYNLAEDGSVLQQTRALLLMPHVAGQLATLSTGLFLPAFLLLCVVMLAEVVGYRGDPWTDFPWAPLALALVAALGAWGSVLVTPEPQTRDALLGMLPAVWIPALLWPMLPAHHTASRVIASFVVIHFAAAALLTLPDTAVREAEWHMTRQLARLPPGTRVGVVEVTDVDRPRALAGSVTLSSGGLVQPWTLASDVVMVMARTSDVRKEWLKRCGGPAFFHTVVTENVFTARAALVRAEPVEHVHEMGIWWLSSARRCDAVPVAVGAR